MTKSARPKKGQRNEKTSSRVGAIAGRVLRAVHPYSAKVRLWTSILDRREGQEGAYACTVGELKALAASCLTQRPTKKKSPRPVRKQRGK